MKIDVCIKNMGIWDYNSRIIIFFNMKYIVFKNKKENV